MKKEGKGFGAQILKFDKPSYTIPARYWKDGYDALVQYSDNKIRRLTILELSIIQTFHDSYKFIGSKKDQIIQIGNAVACRFSYHIANHIYKMFLNIDSNDDSNDDSNKLSLMNITNLKKIACNLKKMVKI